MIPPRKTQILRGVLPSERWLSRSNFWSFKSFGLFVADQAMLIRLAFIPRVKAIYSIYELKHALGPKRGSQSKDIVVVAAHYGDDWIVGAFLNHHRRLGIRNFVFLDLSIDGRLSLHLKEEPNCAVWRPLILTSKGKATFWLNALRARYAAGRWCLSLDTSDAFVFYRCETRKTSDFTEFLEAECRDHAFGVLVEMYGDRLGEKPVFDPADLPYFDAFGLVSREKGQFRDVIVRGGPQRRMLYNSRPEQSPAVNRVPLIRWRWNYSYLSGTKLAIPLHLNNPHAPWHSSPTCCILRYALLCDLSTLNNAVTWEKQSILDEPFTSCYAGTAKLSGLKPRNAFSGRYETTQDLVDCGLLNPGQWF